MTSISELQEAAHKTAVEHGFWEEFKHPGVFIALMHSELSEALETLRKYTGDDPRVLTGLEDSIKIPDFFHLEEELSDCIIRILDFAGAFGLDIENSMKAKMAYNASRPH